MKTDTTPSPAAYALAKDIRDGIDGMYEGRACTRSEVVESLARMIQVVINNEGARSYNLGVQHARP